MTEPVYRTERETPPAGWLTIPLVVDEHLHGYRLDRFLHARIPRLSRARIQRIIAEGNVSRSGDAVRAATRVRAGELVLVLRPAPVEPSVVLDYRVIAQDPHLLVIDKPAGLPVHPSARYHRHTLTAVMRERLGCDHGWEMAHRLDRETSGVIVFGRRRAFAPSGEVASGAVLKRAFAERRIDKRYLAIVKGRLTGAMSIDLPLGPAQGSQIRVKMGHRSGGLAALTDVEPLRVGEFRGDPITLVRCVPRSGRQHQIRVHLSLVGHPVLGDKMYGLPEAAFLDVVDNGLPLEELGRRLGVQRHALHAESLRLQHPTRGGSCTFVAPWPDDLRSIIPSADAERSARQAP